ncbi:hypothetical protein Q9R19_03250 [Microbacterium sp. ARD32]|uniref:hypothetical protein n=1 Tax=Microbacterium sp. ARD32 TaxID=2962577 RepID=UPI0028823F5D|nr:hypothetical protein [Microbacterium sp. ARD32]MDT0156636.1 hypothetical protein [Microbacterium sp. ARD32]
MRLRRSVVIAVGLLSFLLSGCSAVPADPHAVLETKAASVDAAAQDLLAALDAAGLTDASAGSAVDVCQSEPLPGVSYRAGISVKVGEDLVAGFDSLVKQLTASGWEETDAYRDVELDPGKPAGRYERDDITVDVKTGGFTVGKTHYGADEMTLGITIDKPCVRIPHGASFIDFQDLEKDILPRS